MSQVGTHNRDVKRNAIIAFGIVLAVLFVLLAPVFQLTSYGVHPIESVPVNTRCYSPCDLQLVTGQSYGSISYSVFGIGEYLFVQQHVHYILGFFGRASSAQVWGSVHAFLTYCWKVRNWELKELPLMII